MLYPINPLNSPDKVNSIQHTRLEWKFKCIRQGPRPVNWGKPPPSSPGIPSQPGHHPNGICRCHHCFENTRNTMASTHKGSDMPQVTPGAVAPLPTVFVGLPALTVCNPWENSIGDCFRGCVAYHLTLSLKDNTSAITHCSHCINTRTPSEIPSLISEKWGMKIMLLANLICSHPNGILSDGS